MLIINILYEKYIYKKSFSIQKSIDCRYFTIIRKNKIEILNAKVLIHTHNNNF